MYPPYFLAGWLLGIGAFFGVWRATRNFSFIWFRALLLSCTVGPATATITVPFVHGSSFILPAALIVMVDALNGELNWAALCNIVVVTACVWPLLVVICRCAKKSKPQA